MILSLIGGTAATLSAINAMLNSKFSPPCYAGLFTSNYNEVKELTNTTTLIM